MPQPSAPSPSPWLRVLAAAAGLAVVGASIVLSITPVSAAGLEAFSSCADLQSHLERATGDARYAVGSDFAETGGAAVSPSTVAASPLTGVADERSGEGGTNTQVAGIDELDIVEALSDGRILVAREDRVVLVDAGGEQILTSLPVPLSPRITFDDERATLWAVSTDWDSTTLTRSRLEGSAFTDTTTWTVAGRLVDLRRDADVVHLVAVDEDIQPVPLGVGVEGDTPAEASPLPFGGTSPVPCDQVLHSPLPGGPATTLVASFSAIGELTPTAATEIVGAGDNVLVTDGALYVSTPTYDGDQPVTGIHRFDVDDLALTGSGSVTGRLLNQFSLDEHAGHLRAAVTITDAAFIGRPMPMPVEGGVGIAEDTAARDAAAGAAAPAEQPTTTSTTGEPATTSTTVEPTTTSTTETTTTTSTTVEPTTTSTTEATTTTSTTVEPTTTVVEGPEGALNEIVTFDLDGALDVVGRTPRFGHPGETLQGVRFAGDVGYAVTFLQTDPLYVIDLSQPEAPRVLGQIEVPGFSAYLHPISPTQVIGFGPSGDGQVLARLFDIGDPTAPRLLDTITLGVDSPIVYDHHALRSDGERLVIAANDWVSERPARCGPLAADQAELDRLYQQLDELYRQMEGKPLDQVPPAIEELQRRADALAECVYPSTFPQARIVTLTPTGESLGLVAIATEVGEAQRVLPLADGYLIVGPEITRVGASGATQAVLA